MKQKNWALIIGSVLLACLSLTLVFPEWFTGKNPYALSFIKFWTGAMGELKMATPPYPPGPENLLGSDQMGRDMLSFLVYGSRLTLLLSVGVALSRFALAIPLGIAAGMKRAVPSRLIDRFNLVLTTIPPLLIAILVLRKDFLSSLYRSQSILIFILTLTLIGWSKVASILSKSTAQIMAETYILSEKAIGKRPFAIAKSHVLPHLVPEILILFFMEIASVLTLMMQLGLFSVFVGNLKIIQDSARDGFSYFNVTFEPEWSSLLGSARDYIRVAPWIALGAGAMFFFTVLAFNLFGEGLRLHFQKKNQSATQTFKRLFNKRTLAVGAVLVLLVLGLKWEPAYEFAQSVTPETLDQSAVQAMSNSDALHKQIKDHMMALKLEPLEGAPGYVQAFDKSPRLDIASESVTLMSALMSTIPEPLVSGVDYTLISGQTAKQSWMLTDLTANFYDFTATQVANRLCYIDTALIPAKAIETTIPKLKALGAAGIVLNKGIAKSEPRYDAFIQLSISQQQQDKLMQLFDKKLLPMIALNIRGTAADASGQNLFGRLVGQEPSMAQNMIVIGMDCSAPTRAKQQEKLAFYLNLMQNLKAQSNKINRTIVFAFFDGSEGLSHYADKAIIQNKKVNLYLDLTEVDGDHFASLAFSDELAPISRYYGFIFANQFENNAGKMCDERRMQLTPEDRLLYLSEGLATLNFKTNGQGNLRLSDFGQVFVKTLIENTY